MAKVLNKRFLLVIGLSSLALSIGLGFGVSFAAFTAYQKVDQQIGYQGLRDKTMFLEVYNGGTWNNQTTNWDGDLDPEGTHAVYYMYAFDEYHSDHTYTWLAGRVVTPSSGSLNGHYLIAFQLPSLTYNSFNFVRFNPNGPSVPSWNRDDNSLWDQTSKITYSSSTNYYAVNCLDRTGNDGYGHSTAGIRARGKVTVSNGNLVLVLEP